jgi:hypothetical protein
MYKNDLCTCQVCTHVIWRDMVIVRCGHTDCISFENLVIGRSVKRNPERLGSRIYRHRQREHRLYAEPVFVHTASKHWLANVAGSYSGSFATTNASEKSSELWFYQFLCQ